MIATSSSPRFIVGYSPKDINKKSNFLDQDTFKQVVVESLKNSGIHQDLIYPGNFQTETATEYGEHELTGLLHRLGWTSLEDETKSRWSTEKMVYWFINEDGTDFQCMFNSADTDSDGNVKRRYSYYAPKNVGDIPYFPPIPYSIRKLISERYNVPIGGVDRQGIPNIPSDEQSFWTWYIQFGKKKIPLVLTEGAKKCLSALSQGLVAIALFGCTCGLHSVDETKVDEILDWDDVHLGDLSVPVKDEGSTKKKKEQVLQLKETLKRFVGPGTRVILALDNDNKAKNSTRVKTEYAKNRLMKALKDHGAYPVKMEWSCDYKGIDDLIVGNPVHFEERLDIALSGLVPDELQRMYTKLLTHYGGDIRFNDLKNQVEIEGEPFTGETPKVWWSNRFNEKKPKEDILEVLIHYARNHSYDPFKEYLLQLKHVDGLPRVDINNLSTTLLNTNNELYDIYLKKFLVGAVARSMEPGCKNDLVLVLQGEQGILKSTFFADLAKKPEWFDDGLSASKMSEKDETMRLHYSKILELAEIEALFKRKDISQLRADISRRTDKIRLPYAPKVIELPRRSVFCGTVNERFFLTDPEGNRRFMVIPVTKIERLSSDMVDAIWLQALIAYDSGESWWLNEDERRLQESNNKEFEERDEWWELVRKYCSEVELANKNNGSIVNISVTGFLMDGLKLFPSQIKNGDKIRVSTILKQLGYRQVQIRSGPDRGKRVFLKPSETSTVPVVETSTGLVVETSTSPVETSTVPPETTTVPVVETTTSPVVETSTSPVETSTVPVVEQTPKCDRNLLDIYGKIPPEISRVTIKYSCKSFILFYHDEVIAVTNTIENMLKHFHGEKSLYVETICGDHKGYFDQMWIKLAYTDICKWFTHRIKY